MTDVLHLLREFVTAGRPIQVDEKTITIGSSVFAKDAPTAYRLRTGYATIAEIWFAYQYASKAGSAYIAEAVKSKMNYVPVAERKDLVSFLKSEIDSLKQIDPEKLRPYQEVLYASDEKDLHPAKKRSKVLAADGSVDSVVTQATTVADVIAQERILVDRLSILRSKRKDFTPVIDMFLQYRQDLKTPSEKKAVTVAPNPALPAKKVDQKKQTPIIIVPSALTSLITLHNVKAFLEDGRFVVPGNDIAEKAKPDNVIIKRTSVQDPTQKASFKVIDDPTNLTKQDWERVVAVFAAGPSWQFRNWPYKPVEVFNNFCGFHIYYEDQPVHPNIASWLVHKLPISKTKRYQDVSVFQDFWNALTQFMQARPQSLTPLAF